MTPCEIDLASIPFRDTTILTYEIELHTSGKKVGFILMDNEYFKILSITNTIPNLPADHQLPTQAEQNVWITAINRENNITSQGALYGLNHPKKFTCKVKGQD